MPKLRPPLEEAKHDRITKAIAEVESAVQKLVETAIDEEAAQAPGVPRAVVAQLFHARFGICWCGIYNRAFKDVE